MLWKADSGSMTFVASERCDKSDERRYFCYLQCRMGLPWEVEIESLRLRCGRGLVGSYIYEKNWRDVRTIHRRD